MTTTRESELVEAVLFLHAICRPVAFIAHQTELPEAVVRRVIARGQMPQVQRTLFDQPQRSDVSDR